MTYEIFWRGKTPFWHEILDALSSAGIKYIADTSNYTIKVPEDQVRRASGILLELYRELEAGG